MGHGPAVKLGKDNASTIKTKLGVKMFLVYTVVYAIFVGINATSPELMEKIIFGQTAAIIWGFFLIGLALVMALVYNHLCTAAEKQMNN